MGEKTTLEFSMIEQIRLPYERQRIEKIKAFPRIQERDYLKTGMQNSSEILQRDRLVFDAFELEEFQKKFQKIIENIGLDIQTVITVVPETANYNAFVVRNPFDDSLVVGLNSVLLDTFEPDELMFVIGHESGHALFGHTEINPRLRRWAQQIPEESPMACIFHSLSRSQELSADRIGFLSCGGAMDTAVSVFEKMMTHSNKISQIQAKIPTKHKDLFSFYDSRWDEKHWMSSHPYLEIRVKALQAFAEGAEKIFTKRCHKKKFPDLRKANQACDFLLDTMELDQFKKDQKQVQQFYRSILSLGNFIVGTDEKCVDIKTVALSSLAKQMDISLAEFESVEVAAQFIKTVASPAKRLRVMDSCISIALMPGSLSTRDLENLEFLCEKLNLPEAAYQKRISRILNKKDFLNQFIN